MIDNSEAAQILVIDDDPGVLIAARLALAPHVGQVITIASPDGAPELMAGRRIDLILMDMNFTRGVSRGQEGLDWLDRLRAIDPSVSLVLMTSYGGVALAVETLKRGAVDFILKPWRNEKLVATVKAGAGLTAARRGRAAGLDSGEDLEPGYGMLAVAAPPAEGEDQFDLDEIEKRTIERAMTRFNGNISLAAAALGLTRPALYRRLQKHGL